MVAPGKASCTAVSPAALERAYSESELASAPSAETCTRRCTPASRESRAMRAGASTCTVWNDQGAVSYRAPIRLTTMSASLTARATEASSRTSTAHGTIWPTAPAVLRKLACAGCREAIRTMQPVLARRRMRWRPMKPDPPNTVAIR